MKKMLLLCSAIFSFGIASAQSFDMELTLVSPSTDIVGGVPFDFTVQITNNGPTTIPTGDTIFFAPLFDGAPLRDQNNDPVIYGNILQADLAMGNSVNFTRNINVNGGNSGSVNVCGMIVAHFGAVAGGETDSTNWQDCSTLNYTSTVSAEGFNMVSTEDKSYFANGIFFLNVEGVLEADRVNYEVINIAGQVVSNGVVNVNNYSAREEVQMPALPAGVYIVRINDGRGFNSTRKIMINK
ncbi:MAG: T9SS type A sorting domain-containing protein [Cryomorphaceae bacterium]|nr:T9SS type A sorting domain-containing protein [Cryomorphaceae bacterium]